MKLLTVLSLMVFALNCLAGTAKLTHLRLFNNQRVSIVSDLKFVSLSDSGRLDFIELQNGDIFYESEIKEGTIQFQTGSNLDVPADTLILNSLLKARVIGGDGSGGG